MITWKLKQFQKCLNNLNVYELNLCKNNIINEPKKIGLFNRICQQWRLWYDNKNLKYE